MPTPPRAGTLARSLLPSLACLALLAMSPAACRRDPGGPGRTDPITAAPPEFQELYTALDQRLVADLQLATRRWDGRPTPVVFGAELITANGNRGTALLEPTALLGVRTMLDALQRAGVRGVTVSVSYPLLRPDFPNSARYAEFYRQVAVEVKSRGLVLFAKSGPVFPQPEFSPLPVSYAGLTLSRFSQEWRQHVHSVVALMQPDYVTLFNEPSTMSDVVGLRFSVADVRQVVTTALDGLERGRTRVVAGAGTWDDPAYFRMLAELPGLDALDAHVYPVNRDWFVPRLLELGELARANGKGFLVGEAWLNKVGERELGGGVASTPAIFARDVFDFWAPLDQRFLDALVRTAYVTRMEFASLFWTRYLYAYLPYDERTRALPPLQRFQEADRAFLANLLSGTLSPTGARYRELIAQTP